MSALKQSLKATEKLGVSEPTSLWKITDFLGVNKYSTGSSIVIIFSNLSVFIISIS
jgi:hypothetical protein